MNFNELLPALPEILLTGLICVVLIADLFISDKSRVITFWLSMLSLLLTGWAAVVTMVSQPVYLFSGAYVSDPLSGVLKVTAIGIMALVFLYSRDYLRQNNLLKGEFFILGLFGLLGMMVMISANSLLSMYMGLETLSLAMYALVAFDRDNSDSAEAAMKYFILGAIASGTLLYGISWIYGLTGSLQFPAIAAAVADPALNGPPLWFGLAFLVVGIAFKFGAVPFHMWLPDVYQGARSAVTLYVASAPKLAALALIMRILVDGLGDLHEVWQGMLLVVAVLSLILGNVVAIAQTNIKRMLAYSTIAHVGFILVAVFCGTDRGYEAALFYTLTYVVMAAGTFGMVLLMSHQGFEAENIDDFKGLNTRSPWFAFMMLFFMFGLAGVPPWIGFLAKLNVIAAVLDQGFTWLAILMVLASVVGAFYYLRVIKVVYFDEPKDAAAIPVALDTKLVLSLNGVAVLGLGLVPGWLLALCGAVFA
ncbi:MAG TPA: NADH-quinone oxidoreductase subunit NuoN [Woeseiaceae bacterium]